jgi:hypothetical protein
VGRPWFLLLIPVGIGVVVAIGLSSGPDASMQEKLGLIAAGALFALALITIILSRRRAHARAKALRPVAAWGARRGLVWHSGNYGVDISMPLFQDRAYTVNSQDGSSTRIIPICESVLAGPLLPERDGVLAHMTWERRRARFIRYIPIVGIAASIDEECWTFAQVGLAAQEAAPFRGRLLLRARGGLDNRLIAAIEDAATDIEHHWLESAELERKFALRVHDDADPVAVRTMFSPKFIVWLVERANHGMFIELRGQTLMVGYPRRALAEPELDAMLVATHRVLLAVREAARLGQEALP